MSMNIHTKCFFILAFQNEFLQIVDFRMVNFIWIFPKSVEILAWKRSSIVAMNHTIRIQHRHNFYYEPIPQLLCLRLRSKYSDSYESKNWMIASQTYDETVSPGWILAVININFLFKYWGLVIEISSTRLSKYSHFYFQSSSQLPSSASCRYALPKGYLENVEVLYKSKGSSKQRKLHLQSQ